MAEYRGEERRNRARRRSACLSDSRRSKIPTKTVQYREVEGAAFVAIERRPRVGCSSTTARRRRLACKREPHGRRSFRHTARRRRKRPAPSICPPGRSQPDDYRFAVERSNPWAAQVENYWKSLLEPAMQIDIPDEFLGNLIRASQVHCMLAARNQETFEVRRSLDQLGPLRLSRERGELDHARHGHDRPSRVSPGGGSSSI